MTHMSLCAERVTLKLKLRHLFRGSLIGLMGLLAACGGGGDGGDGGVVVYGGGPPPPPLPPPPTPNTVAVVVDGGPTAAGGTVNTLYTTVTVCVPGSTTLCQTVDHVQVDTGSTGLRVLASVLGNGLSPAQLPQGQDESGNPLNECQQFADGYIWGTVRTADIYIGSEVAGGIPIQVMGDPQAAAVPTTCSFGPQGDTVVSLPEEDSVATFGANGVLGIGNFVTDCGAGCETNIVPAFYYGCPSSTTCVSVPLPQAQQLQNPVSVFASDNNGVILTLPAVTVPAPNITGQLTFGIVTQADNPITTGQIYTVDPNYGTLGTTFNGTTFASSFIDSGSNAYFFNDSGSAVCMDQLAFYCPTTMQTFSAMIEGTNGTAATIGFSVGNADAQFATNDPVLGSLGGPYPTSSAFDWGLPFFYGRSVYITFENNSAGGMTGPWIGF